VLRGDNDRTSARARADHVAAVERYSREDCIPRAARLLEQLRAEAQRGHGVELRRPGLSSGAAARCRDDGRGTQGS
jgi:hypothetical protein